MRVLAALFSIVLTTAVLIQPNQAQAKWLDLPYSVIDLWDFDLQDLEAGTQLVLVLPHDFSGNTDSNVKQTTYSFVPLFIRTTTTTDESQQTLTAQIGWMPDNGKTIGALRLDWRDHDETFKNRYGRAKNHGLHWNMLDWDIVRATPQMTVVQFPRFGAELKAKQHRIKVGIMPFGTVELRDDVDPASGNRWSMKETGGGVSGDFQVTENLKINAALMAYFTYCGGRQGQREQRAYSDGIRHVQVTHDYEMPPGANALCGQAIGFHGRANVGTTYQFNLFGFDTEAGLNVEGDTFNHKRRRVWEGQPVQGSTEWQAQMIVSFIASLAVSFGEPDLPPLFGPEENKLLRQYEPIKDEDWWE